MFYTIYKITNNINQKYYIGMHKTSNLEDGYMGSGKLIKRAIQKYSIENFTKEILHVFDNEEDMKNKEKELVVINEMSYNLCDGGHGGFSYINKQPEKKDWVLKGRIATNIALKEKYGVSNSSQIDFVRRKIGEKAKLRHEQGLTKPPPSFLGKKHSEETKQKMRNSKKSKNLTGSKNSQYGTCWITNGNEDKKIHKDELDKFIILGYIKGRLMKPPPSFLGKTHSEEAK